MNYEAFNTFLELFPPQGINEIIIDRETGRSKGFGFVEMPNQAEGDEAIKQLNGKEIDGRNIKVNPADSGARRQKSPKRPFGRR